MAQPQTTHLTSTGKSPIHIVITAVSEDSPNAPSQQLPTNTPVEQLSDFEAKFLQCVRNCWSLMNKNPGNAKDSKETSGKSKSKLEFCCTPLNREKKAERKKRDGPKAKKFEDSHQCLVCTEIERSDGDGSSKGKVPKRKAKNGFEAECKRIFKEYRAYKRNKEQKRKDTVSKGTGPDPCYEVYREISAMQDPCSEYGRTQAYETQRWFNQPFDDYSNPAAAQGVWGSYRPGDSRDAAYGRFGANNGANSAGIGITYGSPGANYGCPGGPGSSYSRQATWSNQSNPQTLLCTPISPSATESRTSSHSTLKASPSDTDTSMLLAIARAAISLSMERQKGESAPQKDQSNDDTSEGDDGSSFCDMLESIFGQ